VVLPTLPARCSTCRRLDAGDPGTATAVPGELQTSLGPSERRRTQLPVARVIRVLGAIAAQTNRARLQTYVAVLSQHDPLRTAKVYLRPSIRVHMLEEFAAEVIPAARAAANRIVVRSDRAASGLTISSTCPRGRRPGIVEVIHSAARRGPLPIGT
jgi:hypothetical protein